MRTQEKSKAKCSGKRVFRVMASVVPNQGGATICHQGFTLVELIVVVAIIGVLATMAIPTYKNMRDSAKVAGSVSEIRTIEKAIYAYNMDKSVYPNLLTDIGPEGNIKDPWGHLYVYNKTPNYKDIVGTNLNDDFDLYSNGPDGVSTENQLPIPPALNPSYDDIARAASGGTVEMLMKDF